MRISKYLYLTVLIFIVLGFGTASAQQDLAQEAYTILQKNCSLCHGEHGSFTEDLVLEYTSLIGNGVIVPGNPNASEFYKRLIENTPEKPRMPWGQPALSADALETIRQWIAAGAPNWEVQYDVNFITMDAMLSVIEDHVASLSAFDRPSARYFTLTHLYNAGGSPEALDAYRRALSKLVNSLSWGFEVIKPEPIDEQEMIFYIDLRHYEWDRNEAWTQIEREYPYSIEFDSETQAGLHEKLTNLRTEMDCEVPFVYVDWFLANASLPPLYHDILDLPETDQELEEQLGVNVTRNINNAPGVHVWRAGFLKSGVSGYNRVVERHTSDYGAYWKSYDFAGDSDVQNIFIHPLTFRHDGGEVVFHLPNGLQGYYISDASGNRINEAPTTIVSNPAASNPAVRNGLSCIGCHTEGMKTFEDEVRAEIMLRFPEGPVKDQGLRLYVEQSKMDALVARDTARYRGALEKTGGVFGGTVEPVHRFYEEFQRPVEAAHAAAAVGLETEMFRQEIRDKQRLRDLGLAGLLEDRGVSRDTWTSNFPEVISALHSPDDTTTQPVDPETDLRPGDLVSIPDPNLRAVIERLLDKAPGALITAADMARLTRIVADDAGISNLTGLEAATQLERIEFRRNSISDLSPLRGLIRLNNIKLRGNRITDVSPLADLVRVDWLGLEDNEITDLSPLKGLTRLNGIGISGNPISDVSPLANLTSLEGINAWRTPISDFSSLAKLTRFRWIGFGDDKSISALPSLKGLKSLRRLEINNCSISDLSGLAELTQLEWLGLNNNQISDISPLRNLRGLEHLNLNANIIEDVSPLAKLTKLKLLHLVNNIISDVSPLAGLTNLERLDLRNNAISDFSPLEGLLEETFVRIEGNTGVLRRGAPKIQGPWLWVLVPVPGSDAFRNIDLLARASNGDITEREIATNGATEGKSVGDNVWFSEKISTDRNNIRTMLGALGMLEEGSRSNLVYGSLTLDSPREQQTKMFAGSDDLHKVWFNGQLVSEAVHGGTSGDYQESFRVTLKQGKNVLLVAIYDYGGGWGGHFGFAPDAEYTVLSPDTRFSFSTAATRIKVGDRFTVQFKTKNISDLAGWRSDITFDPAVLKVNNVREGSFLKQGGGRTHFLKGTIDNTMGRIADVGSARISEGGVSGEGALLSITFTAKVNGESRLSLRKFQAGSSTGDAISDRPPDMIITVEDPSSLDVSDGPFSLSTDVTPVRLGNTFNLLLKAEDVTDLAGWQTDIAFDPDVLETVEVNEGDFLKAEGGDTFFFQGAIDNTAGKITGLSAAKLKGGGNGAGMLLLVTFKAKAVGETRVTLSNFFAGSSSGETISSEVPEIRITIEDRAFSASDVNQDGRVNVQDLIVVAQHLGADASVNRRADVNGDGTINVLDIIVIAQNLGESTAAAPSNVAAIDSLELYPAMVQAWIAEAEAKNDDSIAFRQGIENLQRLLASLLPEKTVLLPNYPNPFNPETWIPYHLAEAADVTVHIYATDGVSVRTLALGHQAAGTYERRSRAVYWDGKNEVGEPVASGVYFYTLTAGDFTATRKLLIRK